QSTVPSALAGLDVEMPWPMNYDKLEQAIADGEVPESVIDDAVTRILRTKFKHGIAPLSEVTARDAGVVESDDHVALARDAARQAMVLLKNEGEVLPLNRETAGTVAVVGPWADEARLGDNGSSKVTPSYAITPFQGIAALGGEQVQVVTSVDASAAEGADVAVVVAALSTWDEGEAYNGGGDRDELGLSAEDEALIQEVSGLAETTIVVLEASGPITMEAWKSEAAAIVMAWYPGMEGGHALGDLLFGDTNFSGRLPQTWPVRLEDEPVFGNQQDETEYQYFHGYRHFDHNEITPLFPFGYGLSYTSFSYSGLTVPCDAVTSGARLEVTVDIENTGARAGVEVAQVYVSYEGSSVQRAPRELKGFARVSLEAGEKKTVTIPVRISDLAYYDAEDDRWVVEALSYGIHVGPNAGDLPLSGAFRVVETMESPLAP
ncbi:MAG: glycoside hydrolase family 3 C-terminal domain-containing protein, partial [Myxococcota bacterium]|nr:glycoside hydrolase family 3 C-terminal domain-containing protein [Myxococcota bacterium]